MGSIQHNVSAITHDRTEGFDHYKLVGDKCEIQQSMSEVSRILMNLADKMAQP
jgi:hypothetical protein